MMASDIELMIDSQGETYLLLEDLDCPEWVDSDYISERCDGREWVHLDYLKDLVRGGCASGQYMPAVTYSQALDTMAQHGDEVLSYLWEQYGEVPSPQDCDTFPSWSGLCCHYLSMAVESWAHGVLCQLEVDW